MRKQEREAISRLFEISPFDPERAHAEADEILLAAVHPEVRAVYESVVQQAVDHAGWWASA